MFLLIRMLGSSAVFTLAMRPSCVSGASACLWSALLVLPLAVGRIGSEKEFRSVIFQVLGQQHVLLAGPVYISTTYLCLYACMCAATPPHAAAVPTSLWLVSSVLLCHSIRVLC